MDISNAIETAKPKETMDLDLKNEQEIPAPDYSDEEADHRAKDGAMENADLVKVEPETLEGCCWTNPAVSDEALIAPKKLVNPCLLSKEHKDLRRELKFNQKLGKNPTEKPELIKVLKERQEKEKKKEMEEYLKTKRTSLDIRLEEQAQKISQAEHLQQQEVERIKNEEPKSELFRIHSKIIKTKSDG